MNARQKRIIAALAFADIVVLLTVAFYIIRTTRDLFSEPSAAAFESHDCQWHLASLLAQARLSGTATLTSDKTLHLAIIYPLAPEQPLDEAAQAIWSAFDAVWALQLSHPLCTACTTVEVTVTARRAQNEAIFRATVSIADLIAHYAGNLSEEAFIERVDFSATYLRPE